MTIAALLAGSMGGAALADQERSVIRVDAAGVVVLRIGVEETSVRLLGVGPIGPDERSSADRWLVGPITMIERPGQAGDERGLPLVELFRGDQSLNEALIENGLARVGSHAVIPPRLRERLQRAEDRARTGQRGTWADRDRVLDRTASVVDVDPALLRTGRVGPSGGAVEDWPGLSSLEIPERPAQPRPSSPWIVGVAPVPEPAPKPAERDLLGAWLGWPDPQDADAWIAWVLGRTVLALLGIWIAAQKRRRPIEGMVLCGGFGVLGVVVEACLPSMPAIASNAAGLPARVGARSSRRARPTHPHSRQREALDGPPRAALPSATPSFAPASRPPSPLAEFLAATSSGSMSPRSRPNPQPHSSDEAIATSVGGLDSVDLIIRPGSSHWEDEPPSPAVLASPFWSEEIDSDPPDEPSEGPSTLSDRPDDSRRISISRDEFDDSRIRGAS